MIADIKKNAEQKMKKTIEALKTDLGKVRTGRAHTGILDHVMVDYYGNPTPLPQVANVTLVDGRTIGVSPYEKKMAQAIEKAIRDSDLGLNPMTQGDMVRVPMPALDPVNAAGTVLMWAEAASAHQAWLAERPQDYGAQVRSRLEHGAALGALQYQQALKQRGPALDDFCRRVFDRCDLLLVPTHSQPAPTRAETDLVDRPEAAVVLGALTRLTRPFNYLGLPTASLPAGFDGNGMPIGLQLVGAPWSEPLLCTAGDAFQRETDWHLRRPCMSTTGNLQR